MRKLAPILTIAVILGGLIWAWRGGANHAGPSVKRIRTGSSSETRPTFSPATSAPASRALPIVPLPFAETAPAATPIESRPGIGSTVLVVVLQVVRETGAPIVGAFVQAQRGTSEVSGTTDSDGKIEFNAEAGATARVVVAGLGFMHAEPDVPLDSGTRRIVVATRAAIQGRVTVDGRVPGEPIQLSLQPGQATRQDEGVANIEPSGRLGEWYSKTDDAGRFEFFNLPPGWTGEIVAPHAYELSGAEEAIPVTAPNADIAIALVERPAIKGRILRNGTKEPVPGYAHAAIVSDGQASSGVYGSDADGRFRILIGGSFDHVTLGVTDDMGLGRRTFPINGPITGAHDVGDVELAPIHQIRIRVHDSAGQPIAGAVAAVTDTQSVSEPTDAEGMASIAVDGRPGEIRVGKLGFRTARMPIPEDREKPLDVELSAGNLLVITVKLPDGSPPPENTVVVNLTAGTPIFDGLSGMSEALLSRTGASETVNEGQTDEDAYASLAPDSGGRIVLGGLRPGADVRIRLRGRTIGELLDEASLSCGAEGVRSVTLRAPGAPQKMVGVVRTAGGDPVDNAQVWAFRKVDTGAQPAEDEWLLDDNGGLNFATSGDDGRFEIDGIFALSIGVAIYRDGFVSSFDHDVPVPQPGAERHFILTPTREVTIELVDEHGRPVLDDATLFIHDPSVPGIEYTADALGNGAYLAKLPPAEVEIEASVGIAHVILIHDARTPVARLVIPSEGGAEIHWRRDASDPVQCRLHVESVAGHVLSFEGAVPAEVADHYLEARLAPGAYWASIEGFDESTGEWFALASSAAFRIESRQGILVEIAR